MFAVILELKSAACFLVYLLATVAILRDPFV